MSPKETAYIVERLAVRFMAMVADYERKLVEHRDSFGARTSADAKIIEGLRRELFMLTGLNDKLIVDREEAWKERDGLLTQVQDMRAEMQRLSAQLDWERAEIKRLQWENVTMHKDTEDGYAAAIKVLGYPVALEPDLTQLHAKGKEAWSDVPNATQWVEEMRGNSEADHDTDAGKASAESAVRTEPVPEEIKVGDVVEVVSNTGGNTWLADVGSFGTVTSIETIKDSLSVRLKNVPDKMNVCGGYVSICDVRKVTP